MNSFAFDEIGCWSEVKLDIVRKYASAYSTIMSAQPAITKHIYIDAFAGPGRHVSRRTGEFVPGSPLNALKITPPFSEIHLIDLDGGKLLNFVDRLALAGMFSFTRVMPTRFCWTRSFPVADMKISTGLCAFSTPMR